VRRKSKICSAWKRSVLKIFTNLSLRIADDSCKVVSVSLNFGVPVGHEKQHRSVKKLTPLSSSSASFCFFYVASPSYTGPALTNRRP